MPGGLTYQQLMNPEFGNVNRAYAPKLLQIHDDVDEEGIGDQQAMVLTKKKPYVFMETVNSLKRWTNLILEDIEKYRRMPIEEFTIGKTYARRRRRGKGFQDFDYLNINTWKLEGISSRWGDYQKKGYDGMVILCAITKDLLPKRDRKIRLSEEIEREGDDSNGLKTHQNFAIALEQQLIQYYAFAEQDPRLANTSLHPGKEETQNAYAFVVYLAFKLEKEE